ncbi:unnamed protein product [Vitrella brassicaformis CCMP3155]|uniref:Uncharacterized protein n=2 Tax=Vitrella brassicaformis TaxID=1169539 RepID=A0A0G4GBJ4_VITBC|nr:unnamed protein product [Vitrella brassicaformis CCMP3155]|eukprot:CEM26367.1 unnamed protein product [Vitrella brassicaformis CCMP3155]
MLSHAASGVLAEISQLPTSLIRACWSSAACVGGAARPVDERRVWRPLRCTHSVVRSGADLFFRRTEICAIRRSDLDDAPFFAHPSAHLVPISAPSGLRVLQTKVGTVSGPPATAADTTTAAATMDDTAQRQQHDTVEEEEEVQEQDPFHRITRNRKRQQDKQPILPSYAEGRPLYRLAEQKQKQQKAKETPQQPKNKKRTIEIAAKSVPKSAAKRKKATGASSASSSRQASTSASGSASAGGGRLGGRGGRGHGRGAGGGGGRGRVQGTPLVQLTLQQVVRVFASDPDEVMSGMALKLKKYKMSGRALQTMSELDDEKMYEHMQEWLDLDYGEQLTLKQWVEDAAQHGVHVPPE